MIISARRRTDIPACYSQWMCQRIKEGYVLVRNPMNAYQISKIKYLFLIYSRFIFTNDRRKAK